MHHDEVFWLEPCSESHRAFLQVSVLVAFHAYIGIPMALARHVLHRVIDYLVHDNTMGR